MLTVRRVLLENSSEAHEFVKSHDALLVPCEYVDSEFHVKHAFHQAKLAFDRGVNIAREFKYEFLLRLVGETQLKQALEKLGGNDCVFVSWKSGIYPEFKKRFVKKELPLRKEPKDMGVIQRAALLHLLR
jgi:tRNA threonylcarbamoyladenosine modification (KEOPS) complex Cgi121 subunit